MKRKLIVELRLCQIHNTKCTGQLLIHRSVHSYTIVITKNDSSHSDFHPEMTVPRFEPRLPATTLLGQLERTRGERMIYVHIVSISTVLTTPGREKLTSGHGMKVLFLLLRPVPVKTADRPSVFRKCNEFGLGNVFQLSHPPGNSFSNKHDKKSI